MAAKQGIFMSMEDIENETPIDEAEAGEVAVTVADDSAEIQADGDEVGVAVSEVEDAVQAGEELEDVAEAVVEPAVESGEGLDAPAAAAVEIAVESILNKIGVYEPKRVVPALESFGNTNTRLAQTKVVLEGIGDWIKKIWNTIKAAAVRLWDKIKQFFASIFKSTEMLTKHIAGLKKRVASLPSESKMKEKTIKAPGLAKVLGIKAKADISSYKEMEKNTAKLAEVGVKLADMQRALVTHVTEMSTKEMNEANISAFMKQKKGIFDQIESTIQGAFNKMSGDLGSTVAPKQPKKSKSGNTSRVLYGPFAGGVGLMSSATLSGNDMTYSLAFEAIKGAKGESVVALDKGEMSEVLASAAQLAFKLNDMKKVQSEIENVTKGINKTADLVISNADKLLQKQGSSTETRQGLNDLKEAVQSSLGILQVIGNRAPVLQFNLAKAGADYVSLSIRNMA